MWCTYNGILFSHKKEWNLDTCYNLDEPWKHAKWKKARHKMSAIVWFCFCEISRTGKFIETESRIEVLGG